MEGPKRRRDGVQEKQWKQHPWEEARFQLQQEGDLTRYESI